MRARLHGWCPVLERKQNILTYHWINISQHEDLKRFGELIVRNGSIVDLKSMNPLIGHLDPWDPCDLKAIQILSSL
jgi:hypothetical protein